MREPEISGVVVEMRPLKRKEVRTAGLEVLGVGPLACMPKTPDGLNKIIDGLLDIFKVSVAVSDEWAPEDYSVFWDHFRAEQYGVGRFAKAEEKNSERSGDGNATQTE